MKIPKYVDELIFKRMKYAANLMHICYELDKWLDKNEIECESYDTHTGVEIYCNPVDSARRVRKAILAKER